MNNYWNLFIWVDFVFCHYLKRRPQRLLVGRARFYPAQFHLVVWIQELGRVNTSINISGHLRSMRRVGDHSARDCRSGHYCSGRPIVKSSALDGRLFRHAFFHFQDLFRPSVASLGALGADGAALAPLALPSLLARFRVVLSRDCIVLLNIINYLNSRIYVSTPVGNVRRWT